MRSAVVGDDIVFSQAGNSLGFGIEESVSVYPNPTNDYLSIQVPKSLDSCTYTLYSIEGDKVVSGKVKGGLVRVSMHDCCLLYTSDAADE